MRIESFFKALGPVIAASLSTKASGLGANTKFGSTLKEGVPLAELDLGGDVPSVINLVSPDTVRIEQGADFSIAIEGSDDAKAHLRFVLDKGGLTILRAGTEWQRGDTASLTITMPAPRSLVLAGSGKLVADALAAQAEITIAGSGVVETPAISVTSLSVNLAGSGRYAASGTVKDLDLTIAGSGDAELAGLRADEAKITLLGSGSTHFASDSSVDARIMGSGSITVSGSARCKVKSFGSGSLVCQREATTETAA